MRTSIIRASARTLAIVGFALATPAFAQAEEQSADEQSAGETDAPSAITITGAVAVVSDYRYRGISQTDEEFGLQGTINVNHESGLYAGVYGYSVADYVTGPGSDLELDVYGGFRKTFGAATVDVGLLYYIYTGAGNADTDFFEPYASIAGTVGPATAKVGIAYAPKQDAIGDESNLYVYGDLAGGIPNTPITLKAHVGYSSGDSFLTLGLPDAAGRLRGENYLDYSLGADFVYKNLTLGVAYVDTDLSQADEDAFFLPHDNKIVSETVVFSLTAAF